VKPSLVDTDILSLFFRQHPHVTARFDAYLTQYGTINFSIITYYEIVSGLKHRDAHKKLTSFLDFASRNTILPLTEHSVTISAEVYAKLRKRGTPLADIDLLIAGIALANGFVLVTRNEKHFSRIEELDLDDWSKPPPQVLEGNNQA
jgi:tRNA(fMet)-specific endonuclease VapC